MSAALSTAVSHAAAPQRSARGMRKTRGGTNAGPGTGAGAQGGLSRRSIELLLLLAASPVVVLLFVLALLSSAEAITLASLAVPLGLFAAFLAAHLALRWLAPGADPALLPLTFVLSGIGIAFVLRLAPELAGRQLIWLFASMAAMVLTLVVVRSVRKLGEYKYTILLIGLLLLIAPAIIGTEYNGSKIWLTFGGFSFQPGELAKIAIVVFLAGYLADNREMLSVSGRRLGRVNLPDFRTLVPLIVMWGISLLMVVFERDLGSALIFFALFVVMLYVATGRLSFVIAAFVLAAVGAVGAWMAFDHVQLRVDIWLEPFADPEASGYQLVQALYSLADGDLLGSGIGRGMPTIIPVVESDFIFIAIAEEMGFLGAAGVLLAFILLAVRGCTIASRAASDMEAFTAAGLTTALSFQALVIVGGSTLLIPLTGVTLPFMSQGGSSLLASFIICGLLLRISDNGSGHEKELESTVNLDGGVLGRIALGKRLTVLITAFCLIFAVAIGNLAYQMLIRGPEIRTMPTNSHTITRQAGLPRGAIVTADGVVLAQSVATGNGSYQRTYPEGGLAAHIVGYNSQRSGLAGIEGSEAEVLRGEAGFSSWTEAINALAGIPNTGNDVKLTLDSRLQRAAESALSGYNGAAVMLDAHTGALLASASAPGYDPNNIEALLEAATAADAGGEIPTELANSPLFNRATQGLYSPGSTFKIVTLTSALENNTVALTDTYEAPGSIDIGGAPVTNYHGNNYGTVTVKRGFELSSNTVFAQIATKLGPQNLVSTAESFGFGTKLGRDFDLAVSLMPKPADMTEWETAWAGAGEPVGVHKSSPAGPQATVVQMALVGAAFANNGTIMNPYVVDSVHASNGMVLATTSPQSWGSVANAQVVAQVNECMEGVVASGTGYETQIAGYTVRGKSGTAETAREADDSWFVGYLEVGGRSVVVAIVLEEGNASTSTPRARALFEEAINIYGP